MSGPVGSSTWFGEPGYNLNQSLRFNDDDDAKLNRTPSSTGNRRTFTLSCWLKGTSLTDSYNSIFSGGASGSSYSSIWFETGKIVAFGYIGSTQYYLEGTGRYRDPSAWYHLVWKVDTTQSTASNRMKIYINGEEVTLGTETQPSQNLELQINNTVAHYVGWSEGGVDQWDGYMGEVNFVDGQALTPSDFGETGDYGEWKPIEYSGSYGTNGFYLNFAGGGIMSATGGTITTDGDYKVNSFTADGTFTPSADGFVEYLVIAGGGGGASNGGGGGAGGYRTGYLPVTSSTAYSITVGTGGALGSDADGGVNGTNSVFSSITSTGGGGGGTDLNDSANDGGSGGGEGREEGPPPGEASPVGQGNDGGNGVAYACGGGGGAGAVGGNGEAGAGTTRTGGVGGAGLASSITGSAVTRAAGGGGGAYEGSGGAGGSSGVGGRGGGDTNGAADAPTANTGSGGGGGAIAGSYTAGTAGATGIVILRYKFQ
jgi:hypothetical protein